MADSLNKNLRISSDEIQAILERSKAFSTALLSVPQALSRLRRTVQAEIAEHMQPWSVLLDECVRFFIYFERLQGTRKFNKSSATFAMQIGRLRSLAISIRALVFLGQESPAHSLARVFLDDLEVAAVSVDDPQFAASFMSEDRNHDEAEFWKNNIGYGRIYPRYERFLLRAGMKKREVSSRIRHHKKLKTLLSSYVHASPAQTFRGLVIPSWTSPGMVAVDTLGHTSIHMPGLCMMIADETLDFAGAMVTLMTGKSPPGALSGYKRGLLARKVLSSFELLQELWFRYHDSLESIRKVRSRV